jgi:gamma-glutamylcyclotransferase (GGCT)/AIG2-like uncharacterized protein YtfP
MEYGESYADLMRPYFFYGTLRPECRNAALWKRLGGRVKFDGDVRAHGWALLSTGIPYAVQIGSHREEPYIVGCLVYPPLSQMLATKMREALDTLEGHPRWYERTITIVDTPESQIAAWIYNGTNVAYGELVPDGDYYTSRRLEVMSR